MSGAVAIAGAPLLAAVLLPFAPARAGAWMGVGAVVVALAVACWGGLDGTDAPGTALALAALFVGATAALASAWDADASRAQNALGQAVLGGVLLALLADGLVMGWAGLALSAVATAAAAGMSGAAGAAEAGWRCLLACGVALALALFGIAVLEAAAPPAAGWGDLARALPGAPPALVGLGCCLLLAGLGTLAALLPLGGWLGAVQAQGRGAACGALAVLPLNAALADLLRLCRAVAACPEAMAPGGAVVALGLASALGGALLLWRERDAQRLLAASTVSQAGVAAVAFGLGGAVASAGLLYLVLHTLAKAALWLSLGLEGSPAEGRAVRPDPWTAWTRLAAGVSVAGLPPAGVFAGEVLVLAAAVRAAPLVGLAAALGAVAGGWALLLRLLASPPGAPGPARGALLGAWANLALALALGVAMPEPVLALLRAVR